MFFLFSKEEIKEFKFHLKPYKLEIEFFFLNVMEGSIYSVWENHLLHRSG